MILKTKRTIIDQITLEDAPFFAELMRSDDWIRFIGQRDVTDEIAVKKHLHNGYLRSYREHGFGYYVIRLMPQCIPIGICGFLKKVDLENPDFGFALLPEYIGNGYAFEASQAVLNYGESEFNFDVLDAVTIKENTRSIKLLKKLGFCRIDNINGQDKVKDPLELFRWQRHAA